MIEGRPKSKGRRKEALHKQITIDRDAMNKFFIKLSKLMKDSPIPLGQVFKHMRYYYRMTNKEFAEHINVSPCAYFAYELKEPQLKMNLTSMDRIAKNLECELIYMLLPKKLVE